MRKPSFSFAHSSKMKWNSPVWKKMALRKRSVFQSLGQTSIPLKPYGMLAEMERRGNMFLKRLGSFGCFLKKL